MGTKNNPGRFDCYANAEPDEPIFVLLGRDKHAPTLVWLWAALRELDGEQADVVSEARDCMSAMLIWQHDRGRSAAGLGQSALVGVLELIRAANARAGQTMNDAGATSVEVLRAWLSTTKFERVDEQAEDDDLERGTENDARCGAHEFEADSQGRMICTWCGDER